MRLLHASAVALFAAAQLPINTRLPVTIELRRDVEVRTSEKLPDGTSHELRGVLYAGKAMQLRRGERLAMIQIGLEGGCRVRMRKRELELSSCPWLEGFTDHQSDIFRVVPTTKRKPAAMASAYGQR